MHDNAEITDKDYLQITITILILFLKEAIMSLTDIAHRVNELASSWEQFKLINDRKLKEIESKGPEQLCKINSNIDNCKERLDFIETSA